MENTSQDSGQRTFIIYILQEIIDILSPKIVRYLVHITIIFKNSSTPDMEISSF